MVVQNGVFMFPFYYLSPTTRPVSPSLPSRVSSPSRSCHVSDARFWPVAIPATSSAHAFLSPPRLYLIPFPLPLLCLLPLSLLSPLPLSLSPALPLPFFPPLLLHPASRTIRSCSPSCSVYVQPPLASARNPLSSLPTLPSLLKPSFSLPLTSLSPPFLPLPPIFSDSVGVRVFGHPG